MPARCEECVVPYRAATAEQAVMGMAEGQTRWQASRQLQWQWGEAAPPHGNVLAAYSVSESCCVNVQRLWAVQPMGRHAGCWRVPGRVGLMLRLSGYRKGATRCVTEGSTDSHPAPTVGGVFFGRFCAPSSNHLLGFALRVSGCLGCHP